MEKSGKKRKRYGLLGKNISYSFSQGYFTKKFEALGYTDHSYENFDLADINQIPTLLSEQKINGFNVTIPYKEAIIPYLDELDDKAATIGAVNTVRINKGQLKGYNTDAFGFETAIKTQLQAYHKKALILGTGGASKAVAYVFDTLGIDYCYVSRNPKKNQLGYVELNDHIIADYQIIVNCSPVGTYPNIEEKPMLPYGAISKYHVLFDLIYNPDKTAFLKSGENAGASIQNGLLMLQQQAEKAWQIWNG